MHDEPYGLDAPTPGPDLERIRGRIMPPAIFLIIVGALNLLVALFQAGDGVLTAVTLTPADLHDRSAAFYKAMIQDPALQKAMLDNLDKQDPQNTYNESMIATFGGAAFWLVLSLLTLFGAIRMMALKSYGLAVTGAIVAAIPCISPTGCCLLGEAAGIWALVVLMNHDVRSAFR